MNKIKAVFITIFFASIMAMLSVKTDSEAYWLSGVVLFISSSAIILMIRGHLVKAYAPQEQEESHASKLEQVH